MLVRERWSEPSGLPAAIAEYKQAPTVSGQPITPGFRGRRHGSQDRLCDHWEDQGVHQGHRSKLVAWRAAVRTPIHELQSHRRRTGILLTSSRVDAERYAFPRGIS